MNRYIIIIITLALQACGAKDSSYLIQGRVAQPELEGKHVFLNRVENNRNTPFDTTSITNGAYRFTGSVAQPELMVITVQQGPETSPLSIELIVENAKIAVATDTTASRVTGTILNDRFQDYQDKMQTYLKELEPIGAEYRRLAASGQLTPAMGDSLMREGGLIDHKMQNLREEFVRDNINNVAGQSQLPMLILKPVNELKDIIAGADSTALRSKEIQEISKYIAAYERVAIGQPFADIRMPDPEGKVIALSDFIGKGKVVLIDFWASWCGPCREEMPNVIKAYNKYGKKGFTVIGISLDSKREAWLKGIKDFNMPWPQMSDVKGWQSEAAAVYAVKSIPHTLLIDAEGIIIAKNLRGEELDKKLAELF